MSCGIFSDIGICLPLPSFSSYTPLFHKCLSPPPPKVHTFKDDTIAIPPREHRIGPHLPVSSTMPPHLVCILCLPPCLISCGQMSHVDRGLMWTEVSCGQTSHVDRRHMWTDVTCGQTSHVDRRHMWTDVTCSSSPPSSCPHL